MMALLQESVNCKKLDTRMIERNMDRGALTQQEWDQALHALDDDFENASWVSLESLKEGHA